MCIRDRFMSRAEANDFIDTVNLIPSVLSMVGALITWMICKFIKSNLVFFSTRIVMRIAVSVGVYNFVNLFSPTYEGASDFKPVMTQSCYAQAVFLISLENLTFFWQCSLIHNVYEVSVKKNLRPEALLPYYDNVAIWYSLIAALAPWMVEGYGWQWFQKCKYSLDETGNASKIFTDFVHALCIVYVLTKGVRMRYGHYLEDLMTTDYKMEEAVQRHRRTQQKLIMLTWVWAFCRVWRILISFINMWEYIAHGRWLTLPDLSLIHISEPTRPY
eukprot:TRINITY_DN4003_c0_g1_i1.p1 TRINITY_DN4003_c0_g1~~TRINITY_DN4003_c0_g1_i1.p1  ORF type:complete len:273 (-),score=69.33 TRINITY_DN4003_c0_g1_i1:147-965(-)